MAYSETPRDEGASGWRDERGGSRMWRFGGRSGSRHGARPGNWRPLEIAAMVLGFIVFWPIGLAILGFKIWQRQTGYEGSLSTAVRQGWSYAESRGCGMGQAWGRNWRDGGGFRGFGGGWSSTGNSAFDDWRAAELARLEEEHRKLEAAEREFADFLSNLRKAKDREEFDRFMRDRNAGGSSN